MTDVRLQLQPSDSPLDPELEELFHNQIAELELKVATTNTRDYMEIYQILNYDLSYPDSHLAELHRNANKLGQIDSKIIKEVDVRQTIFRVKNKICNCCGFFIQEEQLQICTHGILDITNLGSSTIVFFKTFVNLSILLIIMLCIYSIFSLTTNLTTAKSNNYQNSWGGTLDYLSISLSAKINSNNEIAQNAKTYYLVSSWLGVPMLVIWFICFIKMSRGIRKVQNEEKMYTSIADFSVVIERMPTGLTKESVQAMIDSYFLRVAPNDVDFKQLKIQKYNQAEPFYFNVEEFKNDQLREHYSKLRELKEEIAQWIHQRIQEGDFSSTEPYRQAKLKELEEVKRNIRTKNQEIIQKIKKNLKQRKKQAKTFVFVTFQTIQQRDFFLSFNENSILTKIKNAIPFCFNKEKRFFALKDGRQFKNIVIQPAPQPQDIIWGNIGFGQCESLWRKFATFIATLVILGISFAIVYGLSTIQNLNSQKRFVSILISLVISTINVIIIKVIQSMTLVERIYTNNNFQISLAFKSILAQLLNTIFIPIIVNIYIKDNLYKESGLSQDIFILAIANSFIPPIIRLIDPYYIFVYLRYRYYDRPHTKIALSQYELNALAQKPQYQIGLEYIYLISNFLFICFFVSLQPVIPLFGILGLCLMYWVEKQSLFYRSQRPIPGINTIGVIMYQMIYLGGIAYVLGSLTWSIFIKSQHFQNSLVANLVAAGVALLIFIFPYEILLNYRDNVNYKKSYRDRRVYFPAEYDRLNPATKEEGVRQYKQFLLKKREDIDGMTDIMQQNINDQLIQLTQNNTYKKNMMGNSVFGNDQVSMGLMQLLQNQSRNIVDPKILRSYLGLRGQAGPNLQEYVSAIELRDVNPFKESIKLRGSLRKPANQYEHYYMFEKKPDDDFKNMYKSTLHLGDLGITSRILPSRSRKPNNQ